MEWLLEKDGQLLLWLKEAFAHPAMDRLMIFVSSLGNKGWLWIAIGAALLLFGLKNKRWGKGGLLVLLSLAANALLCNGILKPLVGRTRPYALYGYDILIPPVGDPSFPSGHTAASFAAATALYAIDKRWGLAAYAFAALMGFSRLYLGVHFPTDVVMGAIVGALAAKLVIRFYFKKSGKQSDF